MIYGWLMLSAWQENRKSLGIVCVVWTSILSSVGSERSPKDVWRRKTRKGNTTDTVGVFEA